MKNLDEDGLFLIQPDSRYLEKVPVVFGTIHIDNIVPKMLAPELGTDPSVPENMMWEQTEGDVPENTKVDSSTPTPQPLKPEPTPE